MWKIRVIPTKRFDISAMEEWLGRCAEQGLRPLWIGVCLCLMKEGEPRSIRYRLEPVRKERTPPESLLELFAAAGWRYVRRADAFFLFAAEDEKATEPYSDADSRAESLTRLTKAMKSYALRQSVVVGFFTLMLAVALIMRPAALLWILLRIPFTGLLWLAWNALSNIRDWLRVRELRESLALGLSPAPAGSGKKGNAIYALLSALCLLSLAANFALSKWEPPVEPALAPSLTELETIYPVTSDEKEAHYQSFSLLAPVQRLTTEYGLGAEIPPELRLPTMNGFYHPFLDTAYYGLSLPFLARATAKSQMEIFHAVNLDWTFQEMSYPGADLVLIAESNRNSQMAAVAVGGRLAVYSYNGAESLADHVDVLLGWLEGNI